MFSFCLIFDVVTKKNYIIQIHRIYSGFFKEFYRFSSYIRYKIHFELISVHGVRKACNSISLLMDTQVAQYHLSKTILSLFCCLGIRVKSQLTIHIRLLLKSQFFSIDFHIFALSQNHSLDLVIKFCSQCWNQEI